jgi:ribosome-interacting GTPase 1
VPCIFVLNKIDAISIEEVDLLYSRHRCYAMNEEADLSSEIPNSVPISSKMWLNIDELKEVMWTKLDLVRVCVLARMSSSHADTLLATQSQGDNNPITPLQSS